MPSPRELMTPVCVRCASYRHVSETDGEHHLCNAHIVRTIDFVTGESKDTLGSCYEHNGSGQCKKYSLRYEV
jgi:hypothetical protein